MHQPLCYSIQFQYDVVKGSITPIQLMGKTQLEGCEEFQIRSHFDGVVIFCPTFVLVIYANSVRVYAFTSH